MSHRERGSSQAPPSTQWSNAITSTGDAATVRWYLCVWKKIMHQQTPDISVFGRWCVSSWTQTPAARTFPVLSLCLLCPPFDCFVSHKKPQTQQQFHHHPHVKLQWRHKTPWWQFPAVVTMTTPLTSKRCSIVMEDVSCAKSESTQANLSRLVLELYNGNTALAVCWLMSGGHRFQCQLSWIFTFSHRVVIGCAVKKYNSHLKHAVHVWLVSVFVLKLHQTCVCSSGRSERKREREQE